MKKGIFTILVCLAAFSFAEAQKTVGLDNWYNRETNSKTSFITTLHISGIDEIGIVNEITHIIAKDVGVHMRSININSDKGKFEGILKVMVYNVDHIEFLMQRLRKVKGVVSVTRGEE